ncbi:glycosyltransferase [Mycobacterium sp. PS03-16]|nr:glycosyltransferase [Mycobacterium sp. PS03-16]
MACAGTLHQLVNLRLLRRPPRDPAPVTAAVSLLVPARDEAHRIAPTIRSLLAQRGLGDAEILVLDDGSTDGTADAVRAAAGGDPRLRVLTGVAPPPGWLGKPHACAQLAAAARGEILVFVDADVVLAQDAVAAAVAAIRERAPKVTVQVEVDVPAQAAEAVAAGAHFLLCDNMPPAVLREVVALVGGRAELEATGGLTLEVAREVAETGVDYLSVGALTHSAPILDLALDLRVG